MVGEAPMATMEEVLKKKSSIQKLIRTIIDEAGANDIAANQITAIIMAKREHIDGMDGCRALQEQWTEAQCRLMIELLG